MQTDEILRLFADLDAELRAALDGLVDWGETGARPEDANTQYRHDVVADEIIVGRLLAEGFRVLSEESGLHGEGELIAVVDPIDGSTNASRGLPWYATSLCALDAEGPLVGYVANLALGEVFQAVRGEGARGPGGGELRPSRCTSLGDALVAFSGLPPAHGGWAQFRTYGAAALDLCAVASGRFDGFVDADRAHAPWDYLAATLICTEAGAIVSDLDGDDLTVVDHTARRSPVAATTPELHAELETMAKSWR